MSSLLLTLLPLTTQSITSGEQPKNNGISFGLGATGQLGEFGSDNIGTNEFTQHFQQMRQQLNQQISLNGKGLPQLDSSLVSLVSKQLSDEGHKLAPDFQLEVVNETDYEPEDIARFLSSDIFKLSTSDKEQFLSNVEVHVITKTSPEIELTKQQSLKLDGVDTSKLLNLGENFGKKKMVTELVSGKDKTIDNQQNLTKDSLILPLNVKGEKISRATILVTESVKELLSNNKVTKEVGNHLAKENLVANKVGNLVLQDTGTPHKEKLLLQSVIANKEMIDKPIAMPTEFINKKSFDKLQQVKTASEKLTLLPKEDFNKLGKSESNLHQLSNLINSTQATSRTELPSLYNITPVHPASTESITNTSTPVVANTNFQSGLSLRSDFSPNLAARIQWIYSQAVSSAEIMMDPAELGPMNVKMKTTNGETNILFQVTNLQTKEMIEDNLSKLRELLSEQGINLGDTHVKQQSQENKESDDSSGALVDREEGEEDSPENQRLVQEGILDTYI